MRDHALIASAAYVTALLAAETQTVTDEQALTYAISAGLFGGFIAAIWGREPLTWRAIVVKVGAAGMVAPGLVWGTMVYASNGGDVHLRLAPVVAMSGLAGLIAWPLAALLVATVGKIKPSDVLARLKKAAEGMFK